MPIEPASPAILSVDVFRGYVGTRYLLTFAEREWEQRVGAVDAELDAALAAAGVRRWAFWTAWNPRSTLLAEAENRRRQAEAEAELRRRGVAFDPACAASDDARWPAEPGVVEWNRPAEETLARADRFGQWAILSKTLGAAPVLIFNDLPRARAALATLAEGADAAAAAARATLAWHAAQAASVADPSPP